MDDDRLISLNAAIDAIKKCTDIFLNNLPPTIYKADAVEAVKALPPAQPGWIPVTERLPEDDRPVLVTLKWSEDDYEVTTGEYWRDSTVCHGWGNFGDVVIAWQPLPTPYREGEQDGNTGLCEWCMRWYVGG